MVSALRIARAAGAHAGTSSGSRRTRTMGESSPIFFLPRVSISVSSQMVVPSSRSAQIMVCVKVTGNTRPEMFSSSCASSRASSRSSLLISCSPLMIRLPRLWPPMPLSFESASLDGSKRCINISRHKAPLCANATRDIRKSPNGNWRRNSSINLRELPPLSDIVTIALMFKGYFFRCERRANVPVPPPMVTTRRPANRSPVRWYPGTLFLLWLISGLLLTIHYLFYNRYTCILHVCLFQLDQSYRKYDAVSSQCFHSTTVYHAPSNLASKQPHHPQKKEQTAPF